MRTLVNATLSFGLVNVPVGVCSTVDHKADTKFKTLHEKCKTPLKLKKWCESCNMEVTDSVKGYEVAKGEFVVITEEELASVKPERSSVIEIKKFVQEASMGGFLSDSNYWLEPSPVPAFGKAYGVLWKALDMTGELGIGVSTLWGKEYPCAVVAQADGLLFRTLDVIVKPDFTWPQIEDKERNLGITLVEAYTDALATSDFLLPGRDRLQELIAAKVEGREIKKPEEIVQASTPDLFKALEASIKAAQKSKRRPRARTAA